MSEVFDLMDDPKLFDDTTVKLMYYHRDDKGEYFYQDALYEVYENMYVLVEKFVYVLVEKFD